MDIILKGGYVLSPPSDWNTTIGVVATKCAVEQDGHHQGRADGLARTINPVHTQFDGDTIFGLATGRSTSKCPQAWWA